MSDAPSYSEAADGLHSEKSAPVEPAEEFEKTPIVCRAVHIEVD